MLRSRLISTPTRLGAPACWPCSRTTRRRRRRRVLLHRGHQDHSRYRYRKEHCLRPQRRSAPSWHELVCSVRRQDTGWQRLRCNELVHWSASAEAFESYRSRNATDRRANSAQSAPHSAPLEGWSLRSSGRDPHGWIGLVAAEVEPRRCRLRWSTRLLGRVICQSARIGSRGRIHGRPLGRELPLRQRGDTWSDYLADQDPAPDTPTAGST